MKMEAKKIQDPQKWLWIFTFFFLSWWFLEASETYMKGVLSFTDEELVSSDFIHNVTLELRMDEVYVQVSYWFGWKTSSPCCVAL